MFEVSGSIPVGGISFCLKPKVPKLTFKSSLITRNYLSKIYSDPHGPKGRAWLCLKPEKIGFTTIAESQVRRRTPAWKVSPGSGPLTINCADSQFFLASAGSAKQRGQRICGVVVSGLGPDGTYGRQVRLLVGDSFFPATRSLILIRKILSDFRLQLFRDL